MALDNPTARILFQLGTLPTELRTAIIHHGPCAKKTLPCTFWGNGNRTAMALLLANYEEAMLSKLLVVR